MTGRRKTRAALPAALVVAPVDFLRDEMAARGLSVVELARRAHVHPFWIERILRGAPVRYWEAVMLSQALGTSADFWINLQRQWDEARARRGMRPRSARAARWWVRARRFFRVS